MKATTGILLFLFQITIANGSMITFEPPPCMVCNSQLNGYQEAGFLLNGNVSHHNMTLLGSANNGSSGSVRFPFMGSMTMQKADGGLFSLYSVELGEYSNSFMGAQQTITFTGHRLGTATPLIQEFTIDGMMDGPGGMDDFQVFAFSSDFRDMVSVQITGEMFALDNLNTSPVPVPAAVWLFASGLLALTGIARRRS